MSLDPKAIPLLCLSKTVNLKLATTRGDDEDRPLPLSPLTKDDRRQTKIDFVTYKTYLPSYFLRSLPLALNRIMPSTSNLVALHFVSYYGDARLSAGFGLGNLMYALFFGMVIIINSEMMGILCTRAFGENDFVGFRRSAYRGLFFDLALAMVNSFFF